MASVPRDFPKGRVVHGFKGFRFDMTCHGKYQYSNNKTFFHKGKVKACVGGFHFCRELSDVFNYFPPFSPFYFGGEEASNIYCQVIGGGKMDEEGDKIAASALYVGEPLDGEFNVELNSYWRVAVFDNGKLVRMRKSKSLQKKYRKQQQSMQYIQYNPLFVDNLEVFGCMVWFVWLIYSFFFAFTNVFR
jgi:hypothetical protein